MQAPPCILCTVYTNVFAFSIVAPHFAYIRNICIRQQQQPKRWRYRYYHDDDYYFCVSLSPQCFNAALSIDMRRFFSPYNLSIFCFPSTLLAVVFMQFFVFVFIRFHSLGSLVILPFAIHTQYSPRVFIVFGMSTETEMLSLNLYRHRKLNCYFILLFPRI